MNERSARPAPLSELRAQRALLGRLLGYLRPRRRLVGLAVLTGVAQSGIQLVPFLVLRSLIDRLRDVHTDIGTFAGLVGLGLVASIAAGLINVASTYLMTRITEGVVCDLRDQVFASLSRQSIGFWVRQRAGEMTSRILNDVGAVEHLLSTGTVSLVGAGLQSIAIVVLMFVLSPLLAVLVLLLLPLGFVPIRRAGRRIGRSRLRVQEQLALLTAYLQEVLGISGAEIVRAHDRRDHELSRFADLNRELRRREVTAVMTEQWIGAAVNAVGAATPAVLLLVGAVFVVHDHLSLGTVLLVSIALTGQLASSARTLASGLTAAAGSLPIWGRLFEVIDAPPDLAERPGARELPESEVAGEITVDGVSFCYPGQARPALEDLSFRAAPGQTVAVVGPTGAGKSTLGALIARLADPTIGSVSLDGHDLRDLTLGSVSRAVGVVFQDGFLFHASIAENLRYARPDADESALWEALGAVQLDRVVAGLPYGLETVVGERGHRLSGGEQQRLALARALLKDPPVLILDEATSHLDELTERGVQQALATFGARRTMIVIAHRLSTVRHADQILVIDGGRVVEQGTHEELLARGGLYARLQPVQDVSPRVL